LTFQVEKLVAIIDASSNEEKVYYRTWEKSNKLSMMFIQRSIISNIKYALPKTKSVKRNYEICKKAPLNY